MGVKRLTEREWEVISEALAFRLAGELDADQEVDEDAWRSALESAQAKVWERLP